MKTLLCLGATIPFALAAAALPAFVGSGTSAAGMLETVPPAEGTLAAPPTANSTPIPVTFSGIADAGSGLLNASLWYRTESVAWTASGLNSASDAGTFQFVPGAPGLYYFQVVAQDNFGNLSTAPSGLTGTGQGSTNYQSLASVGDVWMFE